MLGPGVPVYANENDDGPKLVMWFLDSRSFVSGSGNGPGKSTNLKSMERPLIRIRTHSARSRLLLGRPRHCSSLHQGAGPSHEADRESYHQL